MATYFEACKCAPVMMGVEMILQKKVDKSYAELANCIKRIIMRHYVHIFEGEVMPAITFGNFFPAIFKEPTKFIIP